MDASDLTHFVKTRSVAGEVIWLPVETPTVEDAARAVGTSPERIVKSLLFLVDGRPILALACGPTRVDTRAIAAHFGVGRKRVKLAGPDAVLVATGFPVGALPPFGHRQPLPTLIDSQVLKQREVFAGGGSINALLRTSPAEIVRITTAVEVDLTGQGTEDEAQNSDKSCH